MKKQKILYMDMFWLFMIGNVLGVILEGLWCVLTQGHWETHVVTIWGPFCLIYGVGAVIFYISSVKLKERNAITNFVIIALLASAFELLCGLLLEFGLGMRAWDYTDEFMNFRGHICILMTILWGIMGLIFARLAVPGLDRMFEKMRSRKWHMICTCLSVFMVINIAATSLCILRWSARHEGDPPENFMERIVDSWYGDDVMTQRFCEWHFIRR